VDRPTATELATEIAMLSTAWPGPIMLIESDCDCRCFEKVLEERAWRFIPSGGWQAVIEILDCVSERGIRGVVGIVDRDFRFALGRLSERVNLFCTDKHDIEMMMYESEAFEAVIRECGSRRKISSWPDGISGIRKHLFQQASLIAYVRLSNEANNSGFCFEKMNYDHFVDRNSVILAVEKFVLYLHDRWSQNVSVSIRDYENGRALAVKYSIN